jgi:hypothetical protein
VFGIVSTPLSASSIDQRARPARGEAHLRLADDRRRVQSERAQHLHRHANISITLDRYGRLMPGAEDEAAGLLDAYLDAARAV